MKLTKITSIFTSVVLFASMFSFSSVSAEPKSSGEMRDITTMELVRDMGIGINLGNTFESCGDWIAQFGDGTPQAYETAWGSPVITQKMIQGIADEGFGVLRVPVAWSNLMGDNYTISSAYLARVKEVIDWALAEDLYVIVNLHWDNGWFANFPTDKTNCMNKYTRIWTQLCEAFKDYDDYLMFESQNEELGWESVWNRWAGTQGKAESYQLANEINQTFVDIVRNSGGNNAKRHLLISGYNTAIDLTCDSMFKMPNDPANRCAVSVHYYTPAGFAILEEDADWGKASSTWGSSADFSELNQQMDMMKTTYIDKGIPVIIGEYGCPKNNKEASSVQLYLASVCEAAYKRQMCPVLWDTPGAESAHYNRGTGKMVDQELIAKMLSFVDKKPDRPTEPPTDAPTVEPTEPTVEPTNAPTEPPTEAPTDAPPAFEVQIYPVKLTGGSKEGQSILLELEGTPGANFGGGICYGTGDDWASVDWNGSFKSDGKATVEVSLETIPDAITDIQVQIWWANTWNSATQSTVDAECVLVSSEVQGAATVVPPVNLLYGDATLDKVIDINDAVLVMSYMANKSKYPMTEEQIASADVYQNGDGLSVGDANSIQKYLAKIIKTLPES